MILIPCGEQCVHQKDGYCSLEKPTSVTDPAAAAAKGCLYFTPQPGPSPAQPKDPDGL